jgi:serine O-acetyltransferase
MFDTVREDIQAIRDKDPALGSILEVWTYAGLWAILHHRLAHKLYKLNLKFLARLVSQWARFLTNIEIHPGATIGRRFFIDHGAGVVIGETAVIGDDVLMYHQVTLGGTSLEKVKRHPTIGNNVLIGMGAKIVGNITVGDNARIGANSVVTRDIPPGATAVGIPARIQLKGGLPLSDQPTHQVMDLALRTADPMGELMRRFLSEMEDLRGRIDTIEEEHDPEVLGHLHEIRREHRRATDESSLIDLYDEITDPVHFAHENVGGSGI